MALLSVGHSNYWQSGTAPPPTTVTGTRLYYATVSWIATLFAGLAVLRMHLGKWLT